MNRSSRDLRIAVLVGLLAALVSGRATAADDPQAKPDPEAKIYREQTIYVPYDKLRQVFEQQGRGVFVPYEKFQELWQAAQKAAAATPEVKPPVGAVITAAENEATVAKDVVRVLARLKIDVLADGWVEIPLRLSDSAITSATLGHQPARLVGGPDRGYSLLVQKKDKKPEQLELTLEYAKAITKAPGQNSVAFEAPQAVVSRWQVRIPEPGVKVSVQPIVATTEAPARPAGPGKPAEETVVLAFVGAAPTVRIEWTPKAEGATGLEALASVQADQQVSIGEGVIRTRAKLTYTISRAELGQLSLEVPADQRVVNVFDANVRQWSVQATAKTQKISIALFEPAKLSQQITLELEKFTGDKPAASLDVPVIKALGAGRQGGVVVVAIDRGLRAEAVRAGGLLQTDASDLPAALASGKWTFAYRYAAVPFELVLSVEKVLPRILADCLVEAYLEPERLTLDTTVLYTIERADVFRLELDVPADYQVRQVRGREVAGAAAAQVGGYHLEGPKKDHLVVELSAKASGRVALGVELQRELHEAALSAPAEKSADIGVAVPRPATGSVERTTGRIMVYAPESLQVNPGKTEGVRSVTFKEALDPVPSARGSRYARLQPVLAFVYTQDTVELSLAAQRRKPQVTVGQLLVVRVEEGVAKLSATFFYNVEYSGVKSLRVDIPRKVAAKLHDTPGIHKTEIQPQPKDVAQGYVAWSLARDAELFGQGRLELNWEEEEDLGKLEVGKSVTLPIPHLQPRDVDRAWGQIVWAKTETIDIQESADAKGLRPIDPQHDLMPGASVSGAARAFEFHEDWKLGMVATRYKLEEVKRTSIERALVRMVLTRADVVSVQALYRMRSARQRLEMALPEGVQFDTGSVRIDGRAVPLERGQKDRFFVPLVEPNPEKTFVLELRYTMPAAGNRLDLPDFLAEPAAQKVYLSVYVPEERVLLEKRGPWTDEFDWELDASYNWRPIPRTADHTDRPLVAWVVEGSAAQGTPAGDSFPVDGRLYVFSTLQPADPPAGSLSLTIVRESLLTGVLLAALVLLGLLLTPTPAGVRGLALGLLLIAFVLGGLFWPIGLRQIVGGKFVAALCVVAVIWSVRAMLRWRPKPATAAAPAAPAAAVAASPPPAPATEPAPDAGGQEGGPSHE